MSPRSEEFMAMARERLAAARAALAGGFYPSVASDAYYAMLYSARAALSEENLNARTHQGVWGLFHKTFVATDRFDLQLFRDAQQAQETREAADYEAVTPPREQAEAVVEQAERFVAAVDALFAT